MNKLHKSSSGFTVVEVLLVLLTLAIIGLAGYFVAKHVDTYKTTISSVTPASSQPATPTTPTIPAYSYSGWKTNNFMPENLKLKFPPGMNLTQPTTLVANDCLSGGQYSSALANGFTIQIEILCPPLSTNNSYGNTDKATEVGSFSSQGTKYYIVNDNGIFLDISSCSNKVCAYTAHSNSKYGVLIFIGYADPTVTQHQSPDPIPLTNSYIPTVENILQSLSY